jgi:hypothetical protein
MRLPRVRFTVRQMMVAVAVVAMIMAVLVRVLTAIDAMSHGPYAKAFNHRSQRLADRAGLVGRPESDLTKILGEPTSVWRYWSAVSMKTRQPSPGAYLVTTYNYAPCSYVPFGMFQVHCADGMVQSTEQLDD